MFQKRILRPGRWAVTVGILAFVGPAGIAHAQLRVASWNISNYTSGRVYEFQTAIYGIFEGRSMAPDMFIGQEFNSAAAVTTFLNLLNTAPNSPGDWAAATFVDGPDSDSAMFYRTTKLTFLGATVVSTGGNDPEPPRNTMRYDVQLVGYTSVPTTLSAYSVHLKSGTAGSDKARRLTECTRIRTNAESLPAGTQFLVCGDTNIQSDGETAYQELVGSQANNTGRFLDPIKSPGSWHDNANFRFVHTQDPSGPSGMDDRHDQILICYPLADGDGFDYIGNPAIPYSTTTWNDPNHSFRAWGNDGTSFNTSLTITGNTMVGTTIAQAIFDSTLPPVGGHLGVFLDFRVPPRVASETDIDFGQIALNAAAQQPADVSNSADVAVWTANGIASLNYTLSASAGFSAPGGSFSAAGGAAANVHTIAMDTTTLGVKTGTLTIASNAPDEPSRVVTLHGEVINACLSADANCDTTVNTDDVAPFIDMLLNGTSPCSVCAGDTNHDSQINGLDIPGFVAALP